MALKTVKVKLSPDLDKTVSFLAASCGITPDDMASAIMALDAFHKGWIRPPQPAAKKPTK